MERTRFGKWASLAVLVGCLGCKGGEQTVSAGKPVEAATRPSTVRKDVRRIAARLSRCPWQADLDSYAGDCDARRDWNLLLEAHEQLPDDAYDQAARLRVSELLLLAGSPVRERARAAAFLLSDDGMDASHGDAAVEVLLTSSWPQVQRLLASALPTLSAASAKKLLAFVQSGRDTATTARSLAVLGKATTCQECQDFVFEFAALDDDGSLSWPAVLAMHRGMDAARVCPALLGEARRDSAPYAVSVLSHWGDKCADVFPALTELLVTRARTGDMAQWEAVHTGLASNRFFTRAQRDELVLAARDVAMSTQPRKARALAIRALAALDPHKDAFLRACCSDDATLATLSEQLGGWNLGSPTAHSAP